MIINNNIKTKNHGFTLLELLVVMSLIAIVAVMIVPRIGSTIDNMRLRAAVRKCAAVLRYARSMAIATQKERSVVFNLNSEDEGKDKYTYEKIKFKATNDENEQEYTDQEDINNNKKKRDTNINIENKNVELDKNLKIYCHDGPEDDWIDSGKYEITFSPRGFSTPAEILFDRKEEAKRKYIIFVDPITGRPKIGDSGDG